MMPKRERSSPLQLRASRSLTKDLERAAARTGRSRSGEAVARLEASLYGESDLPADVALMSFVTVATARIGGLVGVLGQEFRGDALAMLRAALGSLLLELGADRDPAPATLNLGDLAGRTIVADARRAMAKPVKDRSVEEAKLAWAAEVWGLTAIEGKDSGNG